MRRRIQSSIVGLSVIVGVAVMTSAAMAAENRRESATVSFGEWRTDFDPPLDRVTTPVPAMGAGNNHELIPDVVTIFEGGSVNFIIAGAHQPAIYDDHKKPEDVNVSSPLIGPAGGIINDADKRVFRGLDPNLATTPRDRVEVVHFAEPGLYLVICGVVNHFVIDQMYGYVRVLPERPKK